MCRHAVVSEVQRHVLVDRRGQGQVEQPVRLTSRGVELAKVLVKGLEVCRHIVLTGEVGVEAEEVCRLPSLLLPHLQTEDTLKMVSGNI